MSENSSKFRDSAIGAGALAAGGGAAYAGLRAGRAADAAGRAATETAEAVAAVNRARRGIGGRLSKLRKIFHLSARMKLRELAGGETKHQRNRTTTAAAGNGIAGLLSLRELAAQPKRDRFGYGVRDAVIAGGLGVGANYGAVKAVMAYSGGPGVGRRDTGVNDTLDRFARRKGYEPVANKRMSAAVMPRSSGVPDSLKKLIPDDTRRALRAGVEDARKGQFGTAGGKNGIFFRTRMTPSALRAHEIGHIAGKPTILKTVGTRMPFQAVPLGAMAGAIGADRKNDWIANTIAGAGTLAGGAVLADEVDASVRGYKVMRRLGKGRKAAAGAFIGVPTYAAIAAMPAMGWGLRKRRQGKLEAANKNLSAILPVLRELARGDQALAALKRHVYPPSFGEGILVPSLRGNVKNVRRGLQKFWDSPHSLADAAAHMKQERKWAAGAVRNIRKSGTPWTDGNSIWEGLMPQKRLGAVLPVLRELVRGDAFLRVAKSDIMNFPTPGGLSPRNIFVPKRGRSDAKKAAGYIKRTKRPLGDRLFLKSVADREKNWRLKESIEAANGGRMPDGRTFSAILPSLRELADTRPRNSNGQYEPSAAGGPSPFSTSAAYDPNVIAQRDKKQSGMAAGVGFGAAGAATVGAAASPKFRAGAMDKLRMVGQKIASLRR